MQTESPQIEIHEESDILASFVIDLPGKPYLLGRDRGCDFIVNHEQVSRKHLIIRKDWDGIITIEDCGSANGTQLNGKAIKGPVEIFPEDEMQIGHLRLSLINSIEWNEKPINHSAEMTNTLDLKKKHIVLFYIAGLLIVLASLLLFFAV
jgi:pSer/pThr/pTyr-binding forkhead associated (FHA) protein